MSPDPGTETPPETDTPPDTEQVRGSRPTRPTVPISTYRIQLRNGVTIDDVIDRGWLDHAASLGVSHLYLSPVLAAVPGSTHGYDVIDPRMVDQSLGGEQALRRLHHACSERGLGIIIDIVPNHMAADPVSNRYWWDVLRNGERSETWPVFDIDQDHPEPRLRDRIMWPVLDDRYGRVLDDGRLRIGVGDDQLVVLVDDRPLPLCPGSAAQLVASTAEACDDDRLRLAASALANLDRVPISEQPAFQRATDATMADLLAEPGVRATLERTLEWINADADRVHEILEAQHYRLAYWRSARDLGYRRFFDINELIGVKQEDPQVFDWSHHKIAEWADQGIVDGLRVDHPDGLAVPGEYFTRLRSLLPNGWIVAEKILESGEALPGDWAVDGTTGYDFAELISRWFIDSEGLHELGAIRDDLVGPATPVPELVAECKRQVLGDTLSADLNRVTDALLRLCESQRRFRDVTRHGLHEMLREIAVAYPLYRSYVAPNTIATERDLGLISTVVASVRENRPDLDSEVLDLIESILTGRVDPELPDAAGVRIRFEQLTGPAMAKGKEDTAFYREVRLISRCEVGADPAASGVSVAELHDELTSVSRTRPHTMTLLSSHDSKRSEDVRARLSTLTELGGLWRAFATEAMGLMDALDPEDQVDPRTRYMILQTLVGAHPIEGDRMAEFALKSIREAKERTSWTLPDHTYEEAVEALARGVCEPGPLLELAGRFVEEHLDDNGRSTAIAQKTLQLLGPGVPDIYWGSEDWYFRLVDPDNRVVPELSLLDRTGEQPGPDRWVADNLSKQQVVRAALSLRGSHAESFLGADQYSALEVSGSDADRVAAFVRGDSVVVVVTRWPSRGAPGDDTMIRLPAGNWSKRIGARESALAGAALADSESSEHPAPPAAQWAIVDQVSVAELVGSGSVAVLETMR